MASPQTLWDEDGVEHTWSGVEGEKPVPVTVVPPGPVDPAADPAEDAFKFALSNDEFVNDEPAGMPTAPVVANAPDEVVTGLQQRLQDVAQEPQLEIRAPDNTGMTRESEWTGRGSGALDLLMDRLREITAEPNYTAAEKKQRDYSGRYQAGRAAAEAAAGEAQQQAFRKWDTWNPTEDYGTSTRPR